MMVLSIDDLVDAATACGSSIVYLSPDRVPTVEVGGELADLATEIFPAAALDRALLDRLDADHRARLASAHEVETWLATPGGQQVSARVSRSAGGLSARLRVVGASGRSLESLGCPEVVRSLCDRPSGLILIAGRRGSGKTTLATAMLDWRNQSRAGRILTLERPIEICLTEAKAFIVQREVSVDASSFAVALRDAAAEDLDAVVVSELATPEAVLAACDLANAGALVLATVPAISAVAAVRELLAVGSGGAGPDGLARAADLLAEALAGVIAVDLLPRADGRGYRAAHEILLGSAALASILREDRLDEIVALMEAGEAVGMQTFDAALAELCVEGTVRVEHALPRARDRSAFERAIGRR